MYGDPITAFGEQGTILKSVLFAVKTCLYLRNLLIKKQNIGFYDQVYKYYAQSYQKVGKQPRFTYTCNYKQ